MQILLASNNSHKADEIRAILAELLPVETIELVIASELGNAKINPDETGTTYMDNAEIKAQAFYDVFKMPTIADDSGLEIDALDGAPGVISARFAGENGNDKLNRSKVIELLKTISPENKAAKFRAVFCYIDETVKFFVEGTVPGKMIEREIGEGGFGYDPLFVPNGYDITFAEMSEAEKNSISHRANAVRALVYELQKREII